MIIDFNNERFEAFDNFKGGEKTLFSKMHFDGLTELCTHILKAELQSVYTLTKQTVK